MTGPDSRGPDSAGAGFARQEQVEALAGQVEVLRRDLAAAATGAGQATARLDAAGARLDDLGARVLDVGEQVREIGAAVEQLTEAVAALTARPRTDPAPTWLLLPADPGEATETLDGLAGWLRAVYLRYSDAAKGFPECWCWHADVVEELLWLMHAWIGAYHGPRASVGGAGDWHDRQRPGVVRRIHTYAGTCSFECHQNRPGRPATATGGAPAVPADADLARVGAWWGTDRDHPGPEPSPRDTTAAPPA